MIDFEDFPHGADKSLTFPTPPKKNSTDDERFRTSSEEQCDLLLNYK